VAMTRAELLALDSQDQLPDAKTLIGLHWLAQSEAGHRHLNWQAAHKAVDPNVPRGSAGHPLAKGPA
jgi:hypothetical protein